MSSNKVAYLDAGGSRLRIDEAPMPKSEPGRIVIRVKAAAVNPVDWKVQDHPFFIQKLPVVLGEDVAGEVVDVGEGVEGFTKGDRVLSHLDNLMTQKIEHGGFALYCSVPAVTTAKIPSQISFADASVVPLVFDTAAIGLYSPAEKGFLGFPFPNADAQDINKTILLWGGSSSVGALVAQLAVASGIKVVATASKHNFDFCRECGASEVIDYRSPTVEQDIIAAIKRVGGTFAGAYDAISLQDQSFNRVLPVVEHFGGGNVATVLPPPETAPKGIKFGHVQAISPLVYSLWKNYLTPALESGQVKCLPPPLIVGKGLESVQAGLNENKKGVSAKKVVIEL